MITLLQGEIDASQARMLLTYRSVRTFLDVPSEKSHADAFNSSSSIQHSNWIFSLRLESLILPDICNAIQFTSGSLSGSTVISLRCWLWR